MSTHDNIPNSQESDRKIRKILMIYLVMAEFLYKIKTENKAATK